MANNSFYYGIKKGANSVGITQGKLDNYLKNAAEVSQ